ncbi:MAG: PEP-utilizing enzyme [Parcubacteria group bacterium]
MLAYHFHKLIGQNYSLPIMAEQQNRILKWAYNLERFNQMTDLVLQKVENDPVWTQALIEKIPARCQTLLEFSEKIQREDLKKKSDQQLCQLYLDYQDKYINVYVYSCLPNVLDASSSLFTRKLQAYLEKKLNDSSEMGRALSILTTPQQKSFKQQETEDFLRLIEKVQQNQSDINKLIKDHHQRYCWLPFGYDGPAWPKDYFLSQAREMIRQGVEPALELKKIKERDRKLAKDQSKLTEKIKLNKDKKYNYLFSIARELMHLKDYRKDIAVKSYYYLDNLFAEIGQRLSLSSVEVKHILPQEMEDVLVKRKYSVKDIKARVKYSALLYTTTGIKIFTGQKAKEIVKKYVQAEKIPQAVKELKGETACPGKITGRVKIVLSAQDIPKVIKGDILISPATDPSFIVAIKKAAAIVTDKGGITCHAAITSRELDIPCVIGTKIATQVLQDGDKIEVDANQGLVNIIKKA